MSEEPILSKLVREYSEKSKRDLILYNGRIAQGAVDEVRSLCDSDSKAHESVSFILCTYGGDPDSAYRLIRALQTAYKEIRLIINGPCKSAGTLIAIGADKLIMGGSGELGPLDVQMVKPNEIFRFGSGLDLPKALDTLSDSAYAKVKDYSEKLSVDLNLSAPIAAEVATKLVTELMKPIASQIDPTQLGELQRATEIAERYAKCLTRNNLKDDKAVHRLVSDYPSHSFVIDSLEAKKYFNNVDELKGSELDIIKALGGMARYPDKQPFVFHLTSLVNHFKSDEKDPEGDAEEYSE